MIYNKQIAYNTAAHLLQINAIKLEPKNPFTWASGWKSPIYCDNRLALSYPKVRDFLVDTMAEQVKSLYGTDVTIAGVATGAIGVGALVAQKLDLPFVYVRPEPKKHGRQNQIEGIVQEGQAVVIIEDLISTGMSSLNAVAAIKAEGIEVLGMIALFSYGFNVADRNFEKAGVQLHTLSDYDHLIEHAKENKTIEKSEQDTLVNWRKDPSNWSP
ncbi:MAG: orotate phosphoribosyltransferase [Flavobacteriales bacterium]|jgi:orotate phosphoribosyltransferase|nr:orotate phosphoribosyltransferase [Candidatus Arcticimaribacter sp.]